MLPTSAGVEPATSWSPVGRRIQLNDCMNEDEWHLGQRTTKPTIRLVRPAKTQISLRIRAVQSVSADRMCLPQPPGYPKWDKREPLAFRVDVQADLSLCWSHRSHCRFCLALAQLENKNSWWNFYASEYLKASAHHIRWFLNKCIFASFPSLFLYKISQLVTFFKSGVEHKLNERIKENECKIIECNIIYTDPKKKHLLEI